MGKFTGFVRAQDAQIVDADGRPLLLRGVGLGNWLLPEGYMWLFGDDLASPRQIETRVADVLGDEKADLFWRSFRERFIGEADIRAIAAEGFDHVRLPINSRIVMDDDGGLIEAGFEIIDRLIGWCRSNNLWVLLDLHGAPGGQTGTNIDDSPNGRPELFMDDRYRQQTIALWEAIARRYRTETVVLGYDLLNEPLPDEWQHTYGTELARLYVDLTAAIRAIDPDHLLMYEGSHWATNWSIFDRVWDDNSALQFHRYWCAPDRSSIAEYLDARERLGLPIYMGEGGENNPEWIYTATRLYEQHGIGWNFWPWKKLGTVTSPYSATVPDGWPALTEETLEAFLHNIALAECERRADVLDALFARPAVIPAWGFDFDRPGNRFDGGEGVTIVRADGEAEPNWHHTHGEPTTAGETLLVRVPRGTTLGYSMPNEVDAQIDGTGTATIDLSEGVLLVTAVDDFEFSRLKLRR